MPESLNLITEGLEKRHAYGRATFYLKIIVIIGLEVLIISIAAVFSSIFVNSEQLSLSNARVGDLVDKANKLEKTENKLVLIQDRTTKAKDAFANNAVYVSDDNILTLLKNTTGVTKITGLDMHNKNLSFSVSIDNSDNLSKFMTVLVSSGYFSGITLDTLDYKGKQIDISLSLTTK
ncbi:hypothetical protein HY045_00105 [Candidatus Woesebacteria bacterium]|nr:hypothetical protein [Candidatus Woesebacteria bacterium]